MLETPTRTRIGVGFVLLLSALTAIGPLTFDTYLAALPRIAADLSATPTMVQFMLTASLAGLALRFVQGFSAATAMVLSLAIV